MKFDLSRFIFFGRDLSRFFNLDKVTGTASVELWVVLTTLLLVAKFTIDSFGPWRSNGVMGTISRILEGLNSSTVQYTLGIMQLSTTKNDFFQVWAVLMVTLRYSVKVGRPYGKSKQLTLSDMMSSLWAANLLRSKTSKLLIAVPLWLIWTLNAARIIAYFVSSERASRINQENLRLVTDYMKYEHKLGSSAGDPDPVKMRGYKYLVYGEDNQKRKVEAPEFKFQLDLDVGNQKLVTTESIWSLHEDKLLGERADAGNRIKDVCLSFALYKLLRRRFHHLPLHEVADDKTMPEAARDKTRRLILDGILQDGDIDRAFRVTEVELSFLQDSFHGNHAVMFVNGFPLRRLALSLVLVAALSFVAYPVYNIPNTTTSTDTANLKAVTHGVPVSYGIIILIVAKELWEIYVYVFSQWTKVWMLCSYIMVPKLQCLLMRWAVSFMFFSVRRGRWNQEVRQYNILIQSSLLKMFFSLWRPTTIKLQPVVSEAIFESLKGQRSQQDLGSYFLNAFESNQVLIEVFSWANEFETDTHRILVWHIATCLCEIELCGQETASALKPSRLRPRLLVHESTIPQAMLKHYIIAVTISNYCAYLLTRQPRLVPDNSFVSTKVHFAVLNEVSFATLRCKSLHDILEHILDKTSLFNGRDLASVRMGAVLAQQLLESFQDRAAAWQVLEKFWTGFLLHLAASTKPERHKAHLQGRGELITHLWALVSHAGFLGTSGNEECQMDR